MSYISFLSNVSTWSRKQLLVSNSQSHVQGMVNRTFRSNTSTRTCSCRLGAVLSCVEHMLCLVKTCDISGTVVSTISYQHDCVSSIIGALYSSTCAGEQISTVLLDNRGSPLSWQDKYTLCSISVHCLFVSRGNSYIYVHAGYDYQPPHHGRARKTGIAQLPGAVQMHRVRPGLHQSGCTTVRSVLATSNPGTWAVPNGVAAEISRPRSVLDGGGPEQGHWTDPQWCSDQSVSRWE